MKTLIVPVDFSKYSEYALKVAAHLAKAHGAKLLVLHMLEMSDVVLSATSAMQNEKTIYFFKLAEERFKTFLKQPYLEGVSVTPIVKHYKVFSEVNDVALAHNADLIVMGSHGVNGLKEYFVGSNTERVVRYAEVPVLVVKNELTNIAFDVVAYATDFSEESLAAYNVAKKVFERLNAKLYLVHVNLPNSNFKSSLEIEHAAVNFLTKAGEDLEALKTICHVADYTVEQGLLNAANTIGADVIGIATHGRKGLAHMLAGSIGEDIANHASLPVMTFKV